MINNIFKFFISTIIIVLISLISIGCQNTPTSPIIIPPSSGGITNVPPVTNVGGVLSVIGTFPAPISGTSYTYINGVNTDILAAKVGSIPVTTVLNSVNYYFTPNGTVQGFAYQGNIMLGMRQDQETGLVNVTLQCVTSYGIYSFNVVFVQLDLTRTRILEALHIESSMYQGVGSYTIRARPGYPLYCIIVGWNNQDWRNLNWARQRSVIQLTP